MTRKTACVIRRGTHYDITKIISFETFAQLLSAISAEFGVNAIRLFRISGEEIHHEDQIDNEQALYLTNGEDFDCHSVPGPSGISAVSSSRLSPPDNIQLLYYRLQTSLVVLGEVASNILGDKPLNSSSESSSTSSEEEPEEKNNKRSNIPTRGKDPPSAQTISHDVLYRNTLQVLRKLRNRICHAGNPKEAHLAYNRLIQTLSKLIELNRPDIIQRFMSVDFQIQIQTARIVEDFSEV
ncbi:uncharacterized protein LOC135842544 isoform X2 [Planococcus citri]|uniref:uncharacterized protein LOC135842544 isoform X2 n=1 Tax=Planococcus citri TaxID=170843 RepID=UPI0031F95D54